MCVSCFAEKKSNSRLVTVNNEDFVDSLTRYSVSIISFSSSIIKKKSYSLNSGYTLLIYTLFTIRRFMT